MFSSAADIWVTCEGKILKTASLTAAERSLISEAVQIYWATICPDIAYLAEVPPMDWTPFSEWANVEFTRRGFKHGIGSAEGKNPAWEILQDLEARIGIHQGKVAKPVPYCPSYAPFWA